MRQLRAVEIGKMRQLADFLETVPPEDFDLTLWRTQEPVSAIALGPIVFRQGCGFAGCALGWAAHASVFPGLRINRVGDLCYRGATDMDAAGELLGLTYEAAWFHFHKDAYEGHANPAHVARRLRRFAEIVERRLARKPAIRLVAVC